MPSRSWLGSMVVSFLALPVLALAGEPTSGSMAGAQAVVAAGFGFQDEESSFITVKTYDAQSGEVLSSETYELDIKDDGPPSSHPRTRIFAGGVGIGAGSLSEFTLRVYDASNGQFLWEGRLNLTSAEHPEASTHRVVAQIRQRAAVTRVASRSKETGQPYFVLRALHPETGQLVWSDEFSTGGMGPRVERISRSVVGMTGTAPRDIDFRIKMPDQDGRRLLWEDKVEPADDSEAWGTDSQDENANFLRRQPRTTNPSPGLHASWPSSGIETDRRTATVQPAWPTTGFAFSSV